MGYGGKRAYEPSFHVRGRLMDIETNIGGR
jgi:hypothetical protein